MAMQNDELKPQGSALCKQTAMSHMHDATEIILKNSNSLKNVKNSTEHYTGCGHAIIAKIH